LVPQAAVRLLRMNLGEIGTGTTQKFFRQLIARVSLLAVTAGAPCHKNATTAGLYFGKRDALSRVQ
jgi:hypothetical protein